MEYSAHALEQMDVRQVTREEVEETVASPFATRAGHSGRTNYFKTINGYNLRVTIADDNGEMVVVTVWKERLP